MTLSAAFTVNGVANPAAHATTYGATVTLARTSTQGTATWSILSGSYPGMTLPTLTVAAGSNSATFPMVADPSDGLGRAVLLSCSVTDGRTTAVEYAVVGVLNSAGILPVCVGEETARHATYGWTGEINRALATGGGSIAWTSYTPTLSAAGGSPAVGDGDLVGQYRTVGDSWEVSILFTFGASSSLGTGEVNFSLPNTDATIDTTKLVTGNIMPGIGWIADSSTATNNKACQISKASSGEKLRLIPTGTATPVSATAPFTFAAGDTIWISATVPFVLA